MSSTARFDELKKKFDENPRRYFAPLANEFRKSGDAEQAVLICEEFLPQQPGHMSGHIVYGQALFDLGRLDDARTVFETALTLDPENLIALRHLGDIARGHGDLAAAHQWYQRVLEADPRNEEVQALVTSLDAGAASAPPAATEAPVPEPAAPSPPPLPAAMETSTDSLLDLEVVDEHALGASPTAAGLAEGFEPMEFTVPSASMGSAADLTDRFEPGEFTAPRSSVAPLDGLEETAIGAFEKLPEDAASPSLLDFEPTADLGASGTVAPEEPPVDIPPEVIAAEAQLIDARETADRGERDANAMLVTPGESEAPAASPPRVTPSQPFVTETMAELYVKQGFREQALDVYKLLLAASPESQRLRDRVAELQPRSEVDTGPNVREFFARLSALRPGERGAAGEPPSSDDFASFDSFETLSDSGSAPMNAAPPPSGVSSHVAPELEGLPMLDEEEPAGDSERGTSAGAEQSSAPEGAGEGSIDALFGQRDVRQADASAASALAQAFGSESETSEPPAITGRPARAAAGELSLDSVFRDGGARPPRSAQSFSFDQFFSESAAREAPAEPGPAATPSQGTSAQGEPPERSADDIEQFNSWLQGLKQR